MSPQIKSIRVILADDHALVRAAIRKLLEKLPGVEVVGEACDGREALMLVKQHQPDVVLMDITMPGLNGLEAAACMTTESTRVIILSMHNNEEYYWRALRSGAAGYLLKKAAKAELAAALHRVMCGEIYLSQEISKRLVKKYILQGIAERKRPHAPVTDCNARFCN